MAHGDHGYANLRDLGGHPISAGTPTSIGRVWRSARLENISADEWRTLRREGLGRVIDLRNPSEIDTSHFEARLDERVAAVRTWLRQAPARERLERVGVPEHLIESASRLLQHSPATR